MEYLARPLRRAVEDTQWFVANHELRLLHLCTDGDTRRSVLELLARLEHVAHNRTLFVFLDESHNRDDHGWASRCFELRNDYEERRAAQPAASALPALGPVPTGADPMVQFALQLQQIVETTRDILSGVTVILTPELVEEPSVLSQELTVLIQNPNLTSVRWVVVDRDLPSVGPVVQSLGPNALFCDATVDEAERERELAAQVDRMNAAASGPVSPARSGAAWPRGVVPPPRRGAPQATPEQLSSLLSGLGLPPGLASPELGRVQALLFGAASAMRSQDYPLALSQQREAVETCLRLDLLREATVMQTMLAGYQLAAGQRSDALQTLDLAVRHAEEKQYWDVASQALMTVAGIQVLEQRWVDAILTYRRAAQHAETAKLNAMAMECWRLCGSLLLNLKREPEAIEAFKHALTLMGEGLEARAVGPTAIELARSLAALYRQRGAQAQAQSLEDLAASLEVPLGTQELETMLAKQSQSSEASK